MAAAPHAPAAFAALLGALATAEAGAVLATRPGASSVDWSFVVVVVLVSLATTVPLGFLWAQPAAAAAAVSAACVLSLAAFRTLTVAGLLAELTVLYRLGRHGSQLLAAGLALPFLVLALATPALAQARIPAVLLAALGPAAAWAGAAHRSRSEAVEHSAARQAIAGTLLEHTARGERARISRELHDVVAHHISMIAVQAETARLTTPGMPAAGAQRLASIGDTARAALTEMRRLRARGSSSAASPPPSTPASSSPPTASSRKPSPTPGGTLRAPPSTWSCGTPPTRCGCASATTGPGRPRPPLPAAMGCWACGNGPRPSGASCAPALPPAADSWSRPSCPRRPRPPHE